MEFHFAVPDARYYLDRVYAYLEADPKCTIWTIVPPFLLPSNLQNHIKSAFPKRLPAIVGRYIFRWRLGWKINAGVETVYWAMGGLFDTLHQKVQRYKSVLTVHACVSPVPLWYDDAIVPPIVRDKELINRRRINMSLEQRASRSADIIIVQSESYRLVYSKTFDKPTDAIRVIPNAVSANDISRTGSEVRPLLKIAKENPTFIYAGNLWRFKGIIDLIIAFSDVCKKCPTARLLLVGSTVPDMEKELVETIGSLGINDKIKIVERLSQENLFALIQECKALVHPSYYEGMPRTVLEAMDLLTPVIASKIGGIVDIDPNGISISFISPGDRSHLAAQMVRLLNSQEECCKRSELGAALIKENHRPKVVGRQIKKVCAEMLKAKKNDYLQQNKKK
jgi:glycosyltransferase involved in cell wall biosynthesis